MFQGRPVAHTISSQRSHATSCQSEISTGLVMSAWLKLKTLLWSNHGLVVITWCLSVSLGSSSRVGGLCMLITSIESTRLQSYGACYLSSDAFIIISFCGEELQVIKTTLMFHARVSMLSVRRIVQHTVWPWMCECNGPRPCGHYRRPSCNTIVRMAFCSTCDAWFI